MPNSTFAVSSFHGGEISRAAQGRFDKPDYRFSLKTCLNWIITEIGSLTRRPSTRYAGHTRRGVAGRVMKFDFDQSNPFTLEFTDGWLRFRTGLALVHSNDSVVVTAVSAATPAVLQTAAAVGWATNDTVEFFGQSTPLLEHRQFTIIKNDTTHFQLYDALTGDAIDGSTLGSLAANSVVQRVHELATSYIGGSWENVRAVQAETTDILLNAEVAPQALTVTIPDPLVGNNPVFAIAAAVFNDGPYLDPFTSGVQATPSAKSGIISLALSFQAYDATKAYRAGDFVATGGINYRSLLDQNVGNAPGGGAPWWTTASTAEAINDGRGFLGTDIGRLVRLFSEPAAWAVGSAYAIGAVVSYNPTGLPGATQYWSAKAASTGKVPGTDLVNWELAPGNAAIWSWGKITSLSNTIDRALAGSVNFGDMTAGGGVAAAFDGVFSQAAAASAEKVTSGASITAGSSVTLSGYVGKNYSGATDQVIQQATVYPSNDAGFAGFSTSGIQPAISITINLRGKASAPVSAADGTLLGTSGAFADTFSAVTIISSNQTTAWKYVWVEIIVTATDSGTGTRAYTFASVIAELSLFNPPGTGSGSGINVQILGPPLLYTTTIQTWRLGVYSYTTGWPTCGKYYEGRLWLGGAVKNRFDACVSNGIVGGKVDFAPTNFTGAVAASNAISYTLNDDSVNQIVDFRADTPGLIACTSAAEFLIVAPTNGPIAPTNIAARKVTTIGSEAIASAVTEHTRVFVKRFGRKLIDYFADANFNKPSGQNLADKAEHIVSSGIAEIAYASAVTPIIWGRTAANALFGVTYKRDTLTTSNGPTFASWHRHTLGTGRTVESICIGPSVGGDLDALTMVTNDPTTGVRHVEVLTDAMAETADLADGCYLDDAVEPSSTIQVPGSSTYIYGALTINGLWHLNDKTVQVTANGIDLGDLGDNSQTFTDYVVSNGSITVPFGDSVSSGPGRGLFTQAMVQDGAQIFVGMTYTSDGQQVRPMTQADSGARNGPAFGKLSRSHRYAALLVNTARTALSFGGDLTKRLYPANMREPRGDILKDPSETFTGLHQDSLQDDYDYDEGLAWRVTRPLPATIAATAVNMATQDQ